MENMQAKWYFNYMLQTKYNPEETSLVTCTKNPKRLHGLLVSHYPSDHESYFVYVWLNQIHFVSVSAQAMLPQRKVFIFGAT